MSHLIPRPSKHGPTPPPLYLSTPEGAHIPYCHTCGRVISSRKPRAKPTAAATRSTPAKYCSDRCKRNKPGAVDRQIEDAFTRLLDGALGATSGTRAGNSVVNTGASKGKNKARKAKKGDPRIIVECSEVEELVFGKPPHDQEFDFDDAGIYAGKGTESSSNDDSDDQGGGGVQLPAAIEDSSVEAKLANNEAADEMIERRSAGQQRAEKREMVRRAARRGCIFGLYSGGSTKQDTSPEQSIERIRRRCEAVQRGKVVEPSFAKGEWGIRWREET